nr:TetR/AcrR family transcriptional regulator [uncultured Celeribacter sp.]
MNDYRQRTAARRRSQMRQKLIENAMFVFAENGIESTVVEDIIAAADVSRGTFYKYFASNHELLIAVSAEMADELVTYIEEHIRDLPDPVERVALGIRLYYQAIKTFPLAARFTKKAGLDAAGPTARVHEFLPRHLSEGVAQNRFLIQSLPAALDMILGTALACVSRHALLGVDYAYIHDQLCALLRGLGLSPKEAETYATIPLPHINFPATSLLARTHHTYMKNAAALD